MSCASANCSLRRSLSSSNLTEGGREREREGGRERGREGGREGGREREREGEREGRRRGEEGEGGREQVTCNSGFVTDPRHSYQLVFCELLFIADSQVLQFALQRENHWTSHDNACMQLMCP